MPQNYILALDNGTQSVRALLFDLEGNLVHKARVPIIPYVSPRAGWAEQDPEYFWQSLCQACQNLWKDCPIPKSAIVGVALTTQRGTIINVGSDGKPLRPAIIWLDQRRTEGLMPIGGRWGVAFRLVGASHIVAYFQAEAEANWIHRHQPDIWEKTHRYLLLSGYLTYKLTHRFADSVACQVGYIPFDYRKQQWSGRWSWHWEILPLRREQLPELVPPAQIIGHITRAASEATGIPAGLPLVAAAADKACEVLGSGCLQPHLGCLSFGTTATINTTHKRYFEATRMLPPYPSAVPGHYSAEVQIQRGYWMVSWFKEEFGFHEQQLAAEQGVEPEKLFDELVKAAPAGSAGLILQPYWSPGLRKPGPEARGAIIGFSDVHTRAHLYRALLEGLAYALREGAERIERASKVPITELRVSGGGSQSDAALQLTADIFNLPTARPHTYETSGLGAAIVASVGLGLHSNFDAAIASMTRLAQVFEPDPKTRGVYDALYHRVYKRMYPRLQQLYDELKMILKT